MQLRLPPKLLQLDFEQLVLEKAKKLDINKDKRLKM